MFKNCPVTSSHRIVFTSQIYTKAHTHTHFHTLPQATTPKFKQPRLLWTCSSNSAPLSQEQTCCCKNFCRLIRAPRCFQSTGDAQRISDSEREWNAHIVTLIKASHRPAGYAMCLLHKVPSSVMDEQQEDLLLNTCKCEYVRVCVYI